MEESVAVTTESSPVTEIVTADDINHAHELVSRCAERILDVHDEFLKKAIECGRMLSLKKSEIGHGGWLDWLADNCPDIGPRMAQRYMQVANTSRVSLLHGAESLRQSIRLLTQGDERESQSQEREKPAFVIRCAFNKDPLEYDEMEWASFVESLADVDEKRRQKGWIIQPPV